VRPLFVLFLLALSPLPAAAQAPAARQIYQSLNGLRVDPARVYRVRHLSLRRDAVRIAFEEGKLGLLAPHEGRITGAVFTGTARVIALPRDPVERRSLARFLDEPLLDQPVLRAYMRFTDDTANELLAQLERAGAKPVDEPTFVEDWNSIVADLNQWHSLRILADWLSEKPQPYFYAGVMGGRVGSFDVLVDDRRSEQVLIGQVQYAEGVRYFDTWTAFPRGDRNTPLYPFVPVRYSVETAIQSDLSLVGRTVLEFKAATGKERLVGLELSRRLRLERAALTDGTALEFFQNEEVKRDEVAQRGNDSVFIVLPKAPAAGETLALDLAYRGSVITDAGNGVYFVGERGSWYPHVGSTGMFAAFRLDFRWPKRLALVATGKQVEEREEGEWRSGRWESESPITVAGFNLGEYAVAKLEGAPWHVEVYANRKLEQELANRFNRPTVITMRSATGTRMTQRIIWPEPAPSPAAYLKPLGADIAEAIRFIEKLSGPFPFSKLAVAQIPGSFGQGWPGLLYISTLSFLSPEQQSRAGFSQRTQEQFSELVPAHETAHQWWGNLVGWGDYRDQWISEGIANYIALMFRSSKLQSEKELNEWLDYYRRDLLTKEPGSDVAPRDYGPVTLGYRLRSSKSPNGFNRVVYARGTWIFHMLRSLLREPGAKIPDARFARMLQALVRDFRLREMTTRDLQKAAEKEMTPAIDLEGGRSLDWFFDQFVYGTQIPKLSVEFSVRPQADGRFVVRGKLKQSEVPENFIVPVPIYAARTGTSESKPLYLGTVIAAGPETSFSFATRVSPKKLLIDPNMTLLCVTQ
jgi:hypothetical protein